MNRFSFLGFPVNQISPEETLYWIKDNRSSEITRTITVINANKLWLAYQNPRLAKIISNADLVIPEYAVVWGAKKLDLPSLTPVYGVTLTREFLPFAANHQLRPFFLGAKPEVIDVLSDKLKTDYPKLVTAGIHHGYLSDPVIETKVIKMIQAAKPDILFIAMGSPQQEYWMEEHKEELKVPVMIGVGGSFDILAEIKSDTPPYVRGTGLEWLYRLIKNPRQYWRRYLVTNPWFIWQIIKENVRRGKAN